MGALHGKNAQWSRSQDDASTTDDQSVSLARRAAAAKRAKMSRSLTGDEPVGSTYPVEMRYLQVALAQVYGPGPACRDDVLPLPEGCSCLSSIVRRSSPCWTSMR